MRIWLAVMHFLWTLFCPKTYSFLISAPRNAGAGAGAAGGGAAQKTSTVLYGESEELNRVVILTLARAIHIHGYEQQSTGK